MTAGLDPTLEQRARQSLGESGHAIYAAAARTLRERGARGRIVDVGCGTGRLKIWMQEVAVSYTGVDAVRYEGYPADARFLAADLNRDPLPVPDASADIVVSLETIEHLENPRRFCRELVRITVPGGWVLVTTPNQRSLTSLGALLFKEHFSAFRDSCYPAHQTALLDTDLRRIAVENGLRDVAIRYTEVGRMPFTAASYPRAASRVCPRACSDNVLLVGRAPERSAA